MTLTDRSRFEFLGLLDDREQEYMREHHNAAYEAVLAVQDTNRRSQDLAGTDALTEFDMALEWLLRWCGIHVSIAPSEID